MKILIAILITIATVLCQDKPKKDTLPETDCGLPKLSTKWWVKDTTPGDSYQLFSTAGTATWVAMPKKIGYVYVDTVTGEVRFKKGTFKKGGNRVMFATIYN